jgi:diguanylate cyclase (GGDEF)-like protein/PAS domain S-box-containing protein
MFEIPADQAPDPMELDRRRARREAVAIGFAVFIAVAMGIIGLWLSSGRAIRENYRHYLKGIATAAASQVDPDLQQLIREPSQRRGELYARAALPLRQMRAAVPDVLYIYTAVRDGDDVRYVLDVSDDADKRSDGGSIWQPYAGNDRTLMAAFDSAEHRGYAVATDEPYVDEWGSFMTGWAPIRAVDGRQVGIAGVDVDATVYLSRLAAARREALWGLAPAVLLILALSAIYFRVRLRGLNAVTSADAAAAAADRAARLVAAEQARLRNVIEGTNVSTWEADIPARQITVSPRFATMLGRPPGLLGPVLTVEAWSAMLHPEDRAASSAAVRHCFAVSGSVFELDVRIAHAEGHWLWIRTRGTVIERDAELRALRMVGTHIDVTAAKQSDIALKESEGKFRSLFELSPVGIALNETVSGRFLQVNDALVAPTGYTREELLERSYWDITPEEYAMTEGTQLAALEAGGRYGPYEKEYVRKDGTRYPVLLSGIRMQDTDGREVIWSIVQDISQRKAMESELAAAALRDKLTGLANRSLFMDRLQAAILRVRNGSQKLFGVLFLDFDRFKLVNDAMGHDAGDELLKQIAQRLRGALRCADREEAAGNLIARFGGDEFLVLINDLRESKDAERIADRLLGSLAPAYSIHGRDVHSTASVGIVTSVQCLESAEAVVRNADVAMYEAKRAGRACSVLFSEAMHTRLARHLTIESALRKAIGTEQLSLVYQPIVELETGEMTSAEALMRWNHPQLGAISPSEFIPVAEESGLIVALGQWVMIESCRTLAAWRAADPVAAPRYVSVNVSRAELALGERLLERLRQCLEETGLSPDSLQLEVTEREVMRDPTASLALMERLRALGVRLAMDDFGTGTSSLACLRQYPFDVIKIDRSFVHDLAENPDVLAVIHATITLVENLGKASVAEGVEEAAQVAVLQSLGCRFAQGYYFSRPVSADRLLGGPQRPVSLATASG